MTDPTRALRGALRSVTFVVAPTSLVTSLLFYFGWVRTSVQAATMGLHDSLLGFSTQDYVLRSIDPMFGPLVVGMISGLLGIAVHLWLIGWAAKAPAKLRRSRLRHLTTAGGAVGGLGLVLGTAGARLSDPARVVFLASPVLVTAGVVLAGYSLHVRSRFVHGRRGPERNAEVAQLRLVASTLMVLLLFLSLFWSVQRYATAQGQGLALQLVDNLDHQPNVALYSARRLHLQPPVDETDLGDDGSAYRFRYIGLKLLFRANGRYFLRPSTDFLAPGQDPLTQNIVIAESDDLRFEFS